MKNYIQLNGKKIEIPEDKLQEIKNVLVVKEKFWIEEKENGETIAHVGEYEFLVLDQYDDEIVLILKELLVESTMFGSNNDYRGSNVQRICREFSDKIEKIVGAENIVEHTVDLTSDDGLSDYGKIKEKVSVLTAELYRKYVYELDLNRLQKYYWLATPYSTPRHDGEAWVKCVSPRGDFSDGYYRNDNGVRPFLILKSHIFES